MRYGAIHALGLETWLVRRDVVIGGGIAGLAAAVWLAKSGARAVTVLEREEDIFRHASGKNAAILRPFERSPSITRLVARNLELLRDLPRDGPLLDGAGLMLLHSRAEVLEELQKGALGEGMASQLLSAAEIDGRFPEVGGMGISGLFAEQAGALDLVALREGLRRRAVDLRVSILRTSPAKELRVSGEKVRAVLLEDGSVVPAEHVVMAGGAWCRELTSRIGAEVKLVRERRHLAVVELSSPLSQDLPVVWDIENGVYLRRFGSDALVCPCDQDVWDDSEVRRDAGCLVPLEEKLKGVCPPLAGAKVLRFWACLRTFTSDRLPLIGPDSRVEGLSWLAALGGFGISTALAAGELLARATLEGAAPGPFSPRRFKS